MKNEVIEKNLRFYEDQVAPMIRERFPEYESRIAVGIAGEGSDFDSVSETEMERIYKFSGEVEKLPEDKDETDLEHANMMR